jgi:hypothetical protein
MGKSAVLAGFLSAFMPGAGQAYIGYYASGFINIAVVAALISMLNSNAVRGLEPFFGLFLAFFWIFNIIDSVRKAKLYNLHQIGAAETPAPTDSPLFGGVALVILGLILTLAITFDLDMYWLEDVWPLFVLALGIYLLWRYQRTRRELESRPPRVFTSTLVPPPSASSPQPSRSPAPGTGGSSFGEESGRSGVSSSGAGSDAAEGAGEDLPR